MIFCKHFLFTLALVLIFLRPSCHARNFQNNIEPQIKMEMKRYETKPVGIGHFEFYKTEKFTTICWNEKIRLNQYTNDTETIDIEYSISMELTPTPPSIVFPNTTLESYEIDENHQKRILDFVTVRKDHLVTIRENKTSRCVSDTTYTKSIIELPEKKSVEIKISRVKAGVLPLDFLQINKHMDYNFEEIEGSGSREFIFNRKLGNRIGLFTDDDNKFSSVPEPRDISEPIKPCNKKNKLKVHLKMGLEGAKDKNDIEKEFEVDLHQKNIDPVHGDFESELAALIHGYFTDPLKTIKILCPNHSNTATYENIYNNVPASSSHNTRMFSANHPNTEPGYYLLPKLKRPSLWEELKDAFTRGLEKMIKKISG